VRIDTLAKKASRSTDRLLKHRGVEDVANCRALYPQLHPRRRRAANITGVSRGSVLREELPAKMDHEKLARMQNAVRIGTSRRISPDHYANGSIELTSL